MTTGGNIVIPDDGTIGSIVTQINAIATDQPVTLSTNTDSTSSTSVNVNKAHSVGFIR